MNSIVYKNMKPHIGHLTLGDVKPIHLNNILSAGKKRGLSGVVSVNLIFKTF